MVCGTSEESVLSYLAAGRKTSLHHIRVHHSITRGHTPSNKGSDPSSRLADFFFYEPSTPVERQKLIFMREPSCTSGLSVIWECMDGNQVSLPGFVYFRNPLGLRKPEQVMHCRHRPWRLHGRHVRRGRRGHPCHLGFHPVHVLHGRFQDRSLRH